MHSVDSHRMYCYWPDHIWWWTGSHRDRISARFKCNLYNVTLKKKSRVTESSLLDVLEKCVRPEFCNLFWVIDIKETHLKIWPWCTCVQQYKGLYLHRSHTYSTKIFLSSCFQAQFSLSHQLSPNNTE